MSGMTIKYVRGSELPSYFIEKFAIDPNGFFKIAIEPQDREPDDLEAAFEILDEIHEKMKDENPEKVEKLINEAVTTTRNYA